MDDEQISDSGLGFSTGFKAQSLKLPANNSSHVQSDSELSNEQVLYPSVASKNKESPHFVSHAPENRSEASGSDYADMCEDAIEIDIRNEPINGDKPQGIFGKASTGTLICSKEDFILVHRLQEIIKSNIALKEQLGGLESKCEALEVINHEKEKLSSMYAASINQLENENAHLRRQVADSTQYTSEIERYVVKVRQRLDEKREQPPALEVPAILNELLAIADSVKDAMREASLIQYYYSITYRKQKSDEEAAFRNLKALDSLKLDFAGILDTKNEENARLSSKLSDVSGSLIEKETEVVKLMNNVEELARNTEIYTASLQNQEKLLDEHLSRICLQDTALARYAEVTTGAVVELKYIESVVSDAVHCHASIIKSISKYISPESMELALLELQGNVQKAHNDLRALTLLIHAHRCKVTSVYGRTCSRQTCESNKRKKQKESKAWLKSRGSGKRKSSMKLAASNDFGESSDIWETFIVHK